MEFEQYGVGVYDELAAEDDLSAIRELEKERDRLVGDCERAANRYRERAAEIAQEYGRKTEFLKNKLQLYFLSVPHRVATQSESYRLPGGVLRLKAARRAPVLEDEEKLLAWVKATCPEHVRTVQKPRWGDIKGMLEISGGVAMMDGEVVPGVAVNDEPAEFVVEFAKEVAEDGDPGTDYR